MKSKKIITFFLITFLFVVLTKLSFANVITFDQYYSTSTIEEGKIKVHIETNLKNIGSNPIIPGEVHLKLSNIISNTELQHVNLISYDVKGKDGINLKDRDLTTNREAEIIFEVWDPILPNFFYPITIDYEIEFTPKGVFFYQINIPKSLTTIPITNEIIEYRFSKNLYLTYAINGTYEKGEDYKSIKWNANDNMFFEISRLPIPKMPFTMANVFWTIIIVLLASTLMYVSKLAKRK